MIADNEGDNMIMNSYDEFIQNCLIRLWDEEKFSPFSFEYVDGANGKKTIGVFKNEFVKAELNMEYFYNKYAKSSEEEAYSELIETAEEAVAEMKGLNEPNFRDYNECLKFATMRLVQKKGEIDQPAIDFGGDVLIVFQLDIKDNSGINITERILDIWNVSSVQLFYDVAAKMEERYPASIMTPTQVRELAEGKIPNGSDSSNDMELVITADNFNYFGATAVFYPSILETLSNMGDTWILFPSPNQAMAFPGTIPKANMKDLIKSLNDEAGVFSNTLLRFSAKNGNFSVE